MVNVLNVMITQEVNKINYGNVYQVSVGITKYYYLMVHVKHVKQGIIEVLNYIVLKFRVISLKEKFIYNLLINVRFVIVLSAPQKII